MRIAKRGIYCHNWQKTHLGLINSPYNSTSLHYGGSGCPTDMQLPLHQLLSKQTRQLIFHFFLYYDNVVNRYR